VTRHLLGALSCVMVSMVVSACDSSEAVFSRDGSVEPERGTGGASGATDAASSGGGASLPFGAVSCGGETCLAGTAAVQSTGCCTDSGGCGLRIVLSSKCLSKKLRGGVDNRCPAFEIPGKLTLPGCCSPTGCGALATFDDIGCIPNADLGRMAVACVPDVPFD
jgi:hypothetical protein